MRITGRFPESKAKRHLSITLGKMLQPNGRTEHEEHLPYLRAANVQWGSVDFSDTKSMWFSSQDKAKYGLSTGDLVILEGGDVGRSAILSGIDGFLGFQNSLHRARPLKSNDIRFALYWMHHLKSFGYFDLVCSKATLSHFTAEKFAETPYPQVDFDTQKVIADFLDCETARIDQLIEKKQRLVELVNEKRAVETDQLIFGPVDDGLMPSSKVKFLAKRISKGTTPSTLGAELVSEGVRFLRAENVWFGLVTDSPQHYISEETHRMMSRSALEANDILVVIAGATTGKAAVIRDDQIPANTNQAISYVRLWQPYLAPVVSAAIQTKRVQQEILLTSVQSAQPNLAMEDLGNLTVPAPRRDDALTLIEKLESADVKYRFLTDSVSFSIGRLQEFRSALITAAVTGQIDVASWGKQGTTDRRLDEIEEAMQA